MPPKGTINLGFVKAIHSGVNPPLNKKMIWYDENEFVHKVWDVVNETWDYFKINTKLDKGEYTGTAQDLKNDIENLEGINYVWSPVNRTLTLFDKGGNKLSQVSLVSLDNEGTYIRYNATTLSLELYNSDNELLDSIPVSSFIGSVGTQLQLNSNQLQLKDSQGNVLSTVSFTVSNIQGLQAVLDSKMDAEKFSPLSVQKIPFLHGSGYFFDSPFYVDTTNGYFVGMNKQNPTELLDINGNIKTNSYKFTLPTVLTPTPNTLVPKTDGSGLMWYNNNSVGEEVGANKVSVLNAITSMSDAEKDAWRLAQRKSDETYSIGQPQPFAVFPPVVETLNEIQEIVVVGSNLFLNNQSLGTALVSLVSEDTGTEYPLNVEVNQTNPSVLSFGYNFSTLSLGKYWVKIIHNGLVNINKVYIQVLDNIIAQPLPNLSWTGFSLKTNTYFTDTNNTSDFVSFTPNAINFTRKYNLYTAPEGNAYINSSAFSLPNDFYLEFSGTCPWYPNNSWGNRQPTISMGLSAYSSTFDISDTFIAGFGLVDGLQNSKLLSDVSTILNMGDVTNFVFYVIKRGNKIVLGLKSKLGVLYSTYTLPAGNQFRIKLNHFDPYSPTSDTLISFALTKILSL